MAFAKSNAIRKYPQKKLLLLFKRVYIERGLHILPNFFTLGNAFFGFCAITLAAYGNTTAAAYFILWGALFDTIDGRVARYANVTSEFGMQLDSLCDSISFCIAPAVLMYLWQLHNIGILGFLSCSFFLIAGLLRLAKFNLTHNQQQLAFIGVPTTVAGCFLATLVLMHKNFFPSPSQLVIHCFVVLGLAMLMISHINFPTFKNLSKNIYKLFISCISIFIFIFGFIKFLFTIFLLYFAYTFEEFLRLKLKK